MYSKLFTEECEDVHQSNSMTGGFVVGCEGFGSGGKGIPSAIVGFGLLVTFWNMGVVDV
jgi:hypothetical protein